MKWFIVSLVFSLLLPAGILSADPLRPLILEGGYKGGYSSGLLDSYWYQQIYVKGGYRWDTFSFSVAGSRYFNYQVSNRAGMVQGIDVNRINGESELYINDKISVSAEVSGWFGQNDYRRLEGLVGLTIEKGKWSFTGEAGGGEAAYNFETSKELTFYGDFYFEAARYINDNYSIDGSYSFFYTGMDGLADIHKHLFRGGVTYMKGKNLFFFGGAAFSVDSNNYSNIGFDLGGRAYVFKYIKFSLSYMLSYGNSFIDSGDSMAPGPGSSTGNERYTSHRLFLGVSLKYR